MGIGWFLGQLVRYRADRPEKSVLRSEDQGKRGTQLDWL